MVAIGSHAALGTVLQQEFWVMMSKQDLARRCRTSLHITVALSSTAVSRCLTQQWPTFVACPNGHFVVQLDYAPQSCLFSGAVLFCAI